MKEKNADLNGFFVNLNDYQKKAVLFPPNQNLRIIAGPGTGKTTVLTERITHLIKEFKISPQKILTLTFTRKACQNIKNKIAKALNLFSHNSLPVFTYHSFCYFFLKLEWHHLNMDDNKNVSILDGYDQIQLIKSWLLEAKKNKQRVDIDLAKKVLDIINFLQQNLVTKRMKFMSLQKNSKIFKDLTFEQCQFIWNFYLKYSEYKKKESLLDFTDLLTKTYQIFMQKPDVLAKWRKKYRYLMIDEFQDTNPLQFNLVKLLTNNGEIIKTTVVGDPDQTIYGWRGADIDFILNFDKYFCDLKTLNLVINYRSTENIVALANHLIVNNKQRVSNKVLLSTKNKGDEVEVAAFDSIFDQARFVVKKIDKLMKESIPLDQVAVLYRVNSLSGLLENFLLKANVPYHIFKGLEFFKRKEIKELLTLLSILNNPKDIYLEKVLSWIPGVGKITVFKIKKLAIEKNENIFIFLSKNYKDLKFLLRFQEDISVFLFNLKKITDQLDTVNSLKVVVRLLFVEIYQPILENNIDYEQRMKNIDTLIDQVIVAFERDNSQLSIREKITEFLVNSNLSAADDLSNNQKKVSLMTIHNAKGLEFPYVFIFDVSNTNFPNINRKNIDYEEERRLFFVALTRAEEKLVITTNKYNESHFIEEILNSDSVDYFED